MLIEKIIIRFFKELDIIDKVKPYLNIEKFKYKFNDSNYMYPIFSVSLLPVLYKSSDTEKLKFVFQFFFNLNYQQMFNVFIFNLLYNDIVIFFETRNNPNINRILNDLGYYNIKAYLNDLRERKLCPFATLSYLHVPARKLNIYNIREIEQDFLIYLEKLLF